MPTQAVTAGPESSLQAVTPVDVDETVVVVVVVDALVVVVLAVDVDETVVVDAVTVTVLDFPVVDVEDEEVLVVDAAPPLDGWYGVVSKEHANAPNAAAVAKATRKAKTLSIPTT